MGTDDPGYLYIFLKYKFIDLRPFQNLFKEKNDTIASFCIKITQQGGSI